MIHTRWFPFAAGLAIFALDRVTKIWINQNLSAFDIIPVIPGFFDIVHAENAGMAFSLLADASGLVRAVVLIGVSTAVLAYIALLLWRSTGEPAMQRAGLALVFGGALGNLYDRALRGTVTDFLDVYIGDAHWPTFNVADSAITTGAVFLVLSMLLASRRVPATGTR